MKIIKNIKNKKVAKHNDIIKAKGSLSSTAQKMYSMVISMLNKDDVEFQEYALNIDSYLEQIGSSSKNKAFIKEQSEELMSNPFWIDGKLFNWCSYVDIDKLEGYIVFDIHPKLKPYLLDIKNNFTQYELVNILKLKGNYSPRLYEYFTFRFKVYKNEYFKKNRKYPRSYTFDVNIEWLRDTYQVSNGYNYADIKRQIINKAQDDFIQHTDLKFTYTEQKIGRKVDRLIITLQENNKGSNNILKDIKTFISYMRKNYINQNIQQDQKTILAISERGVLYNKRNAKSYSKDDALKIWKHLYKLAQEDKLEVIKE